MKKHLVICSLLALFAVPAMAQDQPPAPPADQNNPPPAEQNNADSERIAGSIRIEPNNLIAEVKNLPKDREIYLYCT